MRMEPMELQHVVFETAGNIIPDGWHCYAVRGGAVARRARLADGKRSAAPVPRAPRGFSFGRPADALIIAARGTRQRPRSETRGFGAFS